MSIKRKLTTDWGVWSDKNNDIEPWAEIISQWSSPVPEFITDSMFSDLNLPTLHISLSRGNYTIDEGMRFFQGLKEFAPGRISKRFSVNLGAYSDWLVPQDFKPKPDMDQTTIDFEISEAFGKRNSYIDEISHKDTQKIVVYKVHQITTQSIQTGNFLTDTSNAFLNWYSLFKPTVIVEKQKLPKGSSWGDKFSYISFYTHQTLTQLEILRYNTGSRARPLRCR